MLDFINHNEFDSALLVTIQKGGVKGSFPAIVVALATISRSIEEKLA